MMGPAVITTKDLVQDLRTLFTRNGFYDGKRMIGKLSDGSMAIPIHFKDDGSKTSQEVIIVDGQKYKIIDVDLPLSKLTRTNKPYEQLKTSLLKLVTKEAAGLSDNDTLIKDIPKNWEIHGDLALIDEKYFKDKIWKNCRDELWNAISAVLNVSRIGIKSVIKSNGFRTPQVTLVYGEDPWVLHTDNHIQYCYDVTKCMFSAGNITEKLRISSFDCHDETIVDLYAGIGYFTLPYLVHAKARFAHACEWNPDAVAALRKNLDLNKVSHRCQIHEGDNRKIELNNVADRVNLGLIPSSEDGWPIACRLLKRETGGILHIHQNVTSKQTFSDVETAGLRQNLDTNNCDHDKKTKKTDVITIWNEWASETATTIRKLLKSLHKNEWNTNVLHIEHVKSYAPYIDHLVLDLECRPLFSVNTQNSVEFNE